MKIKDDLKISGELVIIVTDKSGHITQSMKVPNLVVTAGKQYIASRMAGTTAAVMSHSTTSMKYDPGI